MKTMREFGTFVSMASSDKNPSNRGLLAESSGSRSDILQNGRCVQEYNKSKEHSSENPEAQQTILCSLRRTAESETGVCVSIDLLVLSW